MPNTKSSDIRYQVLDGCLRQGGYSMVELKDAVNKKLVEEGFPPVTSLNTIRTDVRFIEGCRPEIEVIETHIGRRKEYGYADKNTSIYKLQLNEVELGMLTQVIALLSKVQGLPNTDWIESFIQRFKLSLDIDADMGKVVGFDENKYLKGLDYFGRILSAITGKEVIRLTYTSFRKKRLEFIVHPYYIKEYNNRWFLIAKTEGREGLSNYAFDRIDNIETYTGIQYVPNESYDFNEDYFSEMVGVSRPNNGTIQKVTLWASKNLTPYIRTKPIHETQKLKVQEDGSSIINMELYINYELEQLLLSYSDGIKVLAPSDLVDRIKTKLSIALNRYD